MAVAYSLLPFFLSCTENLNTFSNNAFFPLTDKDGPSAFIIKPFFSKNAAAVFFVWAEGSNSAKFLCDAALSVIDFPVGENKTACACTILLSSLMSALFRQPAKPGQAR